MKFIYDRNKTAVIFGDREYSYKEIIKGIKYYSTLLKESGKVVVTMENRPEMICSIFSIWDKKRDSNSFRFWIYRGAICLCFFRLRAKIYFYL